MQYIGVVHDLPMSTYLEIDAVNSSALKLMARSPWHYLNRFEQSEPTKSMLGGNLAHCAVLEPDALNDRYAVVPEHAPRRPTDAQWNAAKPNASSSAAMAWWTEFEDKARGKTVVSAAEYELCRQQMAAVKACPEIANILAEGRGEVSIFWVDAGTGLYCKARVDWLHSTMRSRSMYGPKHAVIALDLKTCADESPSGFGRAAARLRYDLQDAHYTAGLQALGDNVEQFVFAAVTNKAPVLAVPYVLTDEIRDAAHEERRSLMDRLAWCKRENQWPAYGDGVQMLDFPAYAKQGGEVEIEWIDDAGVTA